MKLPAELRVVDRVLTLTPSEAKKHYDTVFSQQAAQYFDEHEIELACVGELVCDNLYHNNRQRVTHLPKRLTIVGNLEVRNVDTLKEIPTTWKLEGECTLENTKNLKRITIGSHLQHLNLIKAGDVKAASIVWTGSLYIRQTEIQHLQLNGGPKSAVQLQNSSIQKLGGAIGKNLTVMQSIIELIDGLTIGGSEQATSALNLSALLKPPIFKNVQLGSFIASTDHGAALQKAILTGGCSLPHDALAKWDNWLDIKHEFDQIREDEYTTQKKLLVAITQQHLTGKLQQHKRETQR